MQLSHEIITASPASIHDNGDHLFWSAKPANALTDSIREFGQTTPLLVQETDNGLELIAGHARLAVLREMGQPALVRLVLDADATDKGLLYFTDNSLRPMDDAMRLAALRYFRPLMDEKTLRSDIMQRLGIKPKSKDAKLFLIWLDMPKNWQDHLAAGHVPLAAGAVLARMDETDRAVVEPIFAGFSWSRSNAVNMLTWLFETAKMTDAPMIDVIESVGVKDIMSQGLSPKDTIARLTTAAKLTRYPEISRLQNTFTKAASEITAGTKWRLNQPNNFETGGAELTIQVKDAALLSKAVQDLETMATLSPWQELWKLGGKND